MDDKICQYIYIRGKREGQMCGAHYKGDGRVRNGKQCYCAHHCDYKERHDMRYTLQYKCIDPETQRETICKFARMQHLKKKGYTIEIIKNT